MMPVSTGVRIGNDSLTVLPATATLRPLRDQIILETIPYTPSAIIDTVYGGKAVRGRVKAVGPGCYPKRYNGPKGRRTKTWDAKCFRPCDVKVGDLVELGGIEIEGYLHPTILWGGKEHVICREEDIAGVIHE